MIYSEPILNSKCEFKLIPLSQLKLSQFQRDLSKPLVKALSQSLTRGFVGVVIVYKEDEEEYIVLDGQHRIEALKPLVSSDIEIPSIVVQKKYMFQPLLYNVEKADNTKDLCLKIFREYEWFVENQPNSIESDVFHVVTLGRPHLLSLAYAFGVCDLDSPSLVDIIAKKFDGFLKEEIFEARKIRVERGQLLTDLEIKVKGICSDYNVRDFNLRKSVISRTSMKLWGRSRTNVEDFKTGLDMLMSAIDESDFSWLAKT